MRARLGTLTATALELGNYEGPHDGVVGGETHEALKPGF